MRLWYILQTRLRSLFFREHRESDLTRRDARGTVLLDNIARDIRFTLRSFLRAPLVAVTIVMTVGLGLGLVAVVFTILNAYIFRVDEVRDPYQLFAVNRQRSADAAPETFTRPQYETLFRETGVFSEAFATTPEIDAWIEGRRLEGPLVTGNFFRVLGVSAAHGRTLTPLDDEPGRPPVIVLSHPTWSRHFASDPGVLNSPVRVNGASFHVVGVMPEGFRGLAVVAPPDFWAPLSLLGEFRRGQGREDSTGLQEDSVGLQIVGRLKPGLSRGQALAQLVVWDSARAAERSGERPDANLVLEPRLGTLPQPAEAMVLFMPLFLAFGLILIIGCANVANLLLARGVARQREIGIRLAVGASRRRVILQLLTESLLLALVSAALAFGISRLVLAGVVHAVTSTFPPDIGNLRLVVPPADWRVVLFLVAGAMVSTIFFALAPALQATRVELVRAIRGEVVRDARPGRARDALVALQVTGSVLLLICAAVFLRSSWAAATVDPGIRTAGIVNVSILNEQRRGTILQVVKSEPLVASVAASWPSFLGALGRRPAFAEGASGKSAVTYQFVSPEYFGVLDIDLVRGRGFTEAERGASAAVAVVSEGTARELWPGIDAVGQVLRLESDAKRDPREPDDPPPISRSVIVVGVARDVAGFRLGGLRMAGAGVYVPISSRGGQNVADDACARRFRACAPCTRRSAGGDRSQHGRGFHAADHRSRRSVSSGDSVLADAGAWSAGSPADVVGAVQCALLSRRATHQGDRRADGAWRNPPQHRRARAVAVGSSRRHRDAPRRQLHGGARRRAPGDASGRADWVDREALRSTRLRCKPALHRHGVHMCVADSSVARSTDQSGRRAQAGLM